jgi:hypothetical protein
MFGDREDFGFSLVHESRLLDTTRLVLDLLVFEWAVPASRAAARSSLFMCHFGHHRVPGFRVSVGKITSGTGLVMHTRKVMLNQVFYVVNVAYGTKVNTMPPRTRVKN